VTLFRVKGSHGQRVAIKTAIKAAMNKAFVLFSSPGAADFSFRDVTNARQKRVV
jgi:hypothetical protein